MSRVRDASKELQGGLTERQALKQISAAEEASGSADDASVEEVEFDDGNASYAAEAKDRSQAALINEHRTPVGEIVACALCKDKGVLGIDCQPEDIRGVMVGPAYVQQRKTSDNPKFVHLNCALFSPEVRMDLPPTWTASTPETRNMLWGVYHATSSVCHVHDHHTMGLHIKHLQPVLTRPKKKCCVCGKAGAFTGCALQYCPRAFHLKCAFEKGAQLYAGSTLFDTDEHMRMILCWEHSLPEFKSPMPESRMVDLAHTVNVDKMNNEEFDRLEALLGLEAAVNEEVAMERESSESEIEAEETQVRTRADGAKEAVVASERPRRQTGSPRAAEKREVPSPETDEPFSPEPNHFNNEEEEEENSDTSYASSDESLLEEIAKKPQATRKTHAAQEKQQKPQQKEQPKEEQSKEQQKQLQKRDITAPAPSATVTAALPAAEPKLTRIPRKLSQSSRKVESESEEEVEKHAEEKAKPVLQVQQAKSSPAVQQPDTAVAAGKTLQKMKRRARKSEKSSPQAAAAAAAAAPAPAKRGHTPVNAVSAKSESSSSSTAAAAAAAAPAAGALSYTPTSAPLHNFPPLVTVVTAKSQMPCMVQARCLPQQIPWPAEIRTDKVAPFDENFKTALAAQLAIDEVMLAEIYSPDLERMIDTYKQHMQTKFMTNDDKSLAIVPMDTPVGAELATFLASHGLSVPRRVKIALLYTAQASRASPMMQLMNPMAMMHMALQQGNPMQFMPPGMGQPPHMGQQPPHMPQQPPHMAQSPHMVPSPQLGAQQQQPQPPHQMQQHVPGPGGAATTSTPFLPSQPNFMPPMMAPSPPGMPPMSLAHPPQPPQQQLHQPHQMPLPQQPQPSPPPFALPGPSGPSGPSGSSMQMLPHMQGAPGMVPEAMFQTQPMTWGGPPTTTNGHSAASERKPSLERRDDRRDDRRGRSRSRSRSPRSSRYSSSSRRRSDSPSRRGKRRRSYSRSRSRSRSWSRSRSRSPRRSDRSDRSRDKQNRDKEHWKRQSGGSKIQDKKAQGYVFVNTKKVSNLDKIQPPAPAKKSSGSDPLLDWS